jgi:hypothetical protein
MVSEPSLVSRQCLGKRKAHRSRIEKANHRETVTLTLDPSSRKVERQDLPRRHHHHRWPSPRRCAEESPEPPWEGSLLWHVNHPRS